VHGFDPVLFDLDGTVVDTVELIVQSFRHAVRTVLGEDLPDEYITAGVGQPLMTQMERLSNDKARELYDVYREYNHRRHDELIRSYDGIAEALATLKAAGRRLGIVTSKSRDTTAMAFAAVGMRSAFDVVVTASDTEAHKPAPEPILLCLERLAAAGSGGPREPTCVRPGADGPAPAPIYIGDSPVDIRAGRAAGVATAAVGWGVFSREALLASGPDYWLDEPSELVGLCLRGEGRPAREAPGAPLPRPAAPSPGAD
jgi:pyrophosphatase PpaX